MVSEEKWLSENLRVFQGEATDEYDKLELVMPLLGLYAQLYAMHSTQGSKRHMLRRRRSIPGLSPDDQDGRTGAADQTERTSFEHGLAVWRELCEHKEQIFPARIVIRQPKPQTQAQATGQGSFKCSTSAKGLGESNKQTSALGSASAPSAKPVLRPSITRLLSGGVAGASLTFELFGGMVEAMERLLDEDAELHRLVVEAVERRSRSLQAADEAHRAEAPEKKAAKRSSLFAVANSVMVQNRTSNRKGPVDTAEVQLEPRDSVGC